MHFVKFWCPVHSLLKWRFQLVRDVCFVGSYLIFPSYIHADDLLAALNSIIKNDSISSPIADTARTSARHFTSSLFSMQWKMSGGTLSIEVQARCH